MTYVQSHINTLASRFITRARWLGISDGWRHPTEPSGSCLRFFTLTTACAVAQWWLSLTCAARNERHPRTWQILWWAWRDVLPRTAGGTADRTVAGHAGHDDLGDYGTLPRRRLCVRPNTEMSCGEKRRPRTHWLSVYSKSSWIACRVFSSMLVFRRSNSPPECARAAAPAVPSVVDRSVWYPGQWDWTDLVLVVLVSDRVPAENKQHA